MDFKKEERKASFRVFDDRRLNCRMRIIPIGKKALPDIQVESKLDGQIE